MGKDLNGGGSCCVGSSSLSTQHKNFKNEAIDQNIYFSVLVAAAGIFYISMLLCYFKGHLASKQRVSEADADFMTLNPSLLRI